MAVQKRNKSLPAMDLPLLLALPLLVLFFLLWLLRQRRSKIDDQIPSPSKQLQLPLPPGPRGIPILGNLHQLGSLPHHCLAALAAKHGPLMLLHLGQVPTLVVSSANEAREIMKNQDLIFASRPSFKIAEPLFYGTNDLALAPYGEYWRQTRKLSVTHLFSAKRVQSLSRVREEEVAFMIDNISSRAAGSSVVNMSEVLYSFTNNQLCRVISGKFGVEGERNNIFRTLIEENSSLFGSFHVEDYIPYLAWIDVFVGLNARAWRNSKKWGDVLDSIIQEHTNRTRGGEQLDEVEDFVDVLLSLQKDPNMDFELSKENIKALLVDLFAAGTDTSYIVLEWAMVELIRNPETMRAVKEEVRRIAGGKGPVREEDLAEMRYLKGVLKEVLRLHPPLPLLLPHESMEDTVVQGYRVPNKTRVLINTWAIGRDRNFWEEPEEFRPERFLDSTVDFRGNDFMLVPFGAGRRICPGLNFAVITIELALANLANQFDWDLPAGMRREDLDMDEAPGITVRRKEKLELLAKPSNSCV